MSTRAVLRGAAWLLVAGLVAAIVLVLVTLGRSLGGGGQTISADQAARELAAASPSAATPPDTAAPSAAPTGAPPSRPTGAPSRPAGASTPSPGPSASAGRPGGAAATRPARDAAGRPSVVRARGGTVTGACAGDRAVLLSWTPAQGYAVDEVERDEAKVRFDGPGGRSEVRLRCAGGVLRAELR